MVYSFSSKIVVMIIVAMLFLMGGSVYASSLKVGTGGTSGNYYAMGNDISSYCKGSLAEGDDLQIFESGASVDNINGMKNKKFSAGFIQEDVLQYYSKQDPRGINGNRMKIISGLHMEVLYLLIPKGYEPEGNLLSSFSSMFEDDEPLSLDVLEGQSIAASGGAVVSAEALSFFTGVKYDVVPYKGKTPTNMPILLVGGQSYAPVEKLLTTGQYNLVSLDGDTIQRGAPFYTKLNVTYTIDGANYKASTVGVRALLVGKSFRKEDRNTSMLGLASCIYESLADLADDPDTNPNWQSVYELNDGSQQTNWPYFPIN